MAITNIDIETVTSGFRPPRSDNDSNFFNEATWDTFIV
jgi:hypothetical protein